LIPGEPASPKAGAATMVNPNRAASPELAAKSLDLIAFVMSSPHFLSDACLHAWRPFRAQLARDFWIALK
jgi:hypothetical protein